jgi:ABC-type amino acid transport substrate-binding protein
MFLKQYQIGNNAKNVFYLFKRNYNMKKLSVQMDKNPHVKNIVDEQMKKKQQQGILKRLIDKRYLVELLQIRNQTSHFRMTDYKAL